MIIGIEKNKRMRNTEFTDYYCGCTVELQWLEQA